MGALNDEQQAALRKFRRDVLGVAPEISAVLNEAQSKEQASVRKARPSRSSPNNATSRHKKRPPSTLLIDVAKETRLPLEELVRESHKAGIQLSPKPGRTRLFPQEAEHLRRYAASKAARPFLTKHTYVPDPAGRISLEDYDRLDPQYAEKLRTLAFLPVRKNIKSFPARAWNEIIRHHRRLIVLKAEADRKSTTVKRRNGAATEAPVESGRAGQGAIEATKEATKTNALAPFNPSSAEIKRELDARRHRREIDPESKLQAVGIRVATPRADAMPTPIGTGNAALEELQLILAGFAPKDHPMFFASLAAVLELDERIVSSVPDGSHSFNLTDQSLRSLIRLVCGGKFGLFAYHAVSNTLRAKSRSNGRSASPVTMTNALTKLHPMETGVLTDAGKNRFIFWHVEQDRTRLAVVTFGALSSWAEGIGQGAYLPLRGRMICVQRRATLTQIDREDAQFMVEAALKLRKGIHIRRSAPASSETRKSNTANALATPPQRSLVYKPHSDWLIPVVIENGFAKAGLDEDFFSKQGGRSAHEVRSFMRRAPGTVHSAPKTVAVSAHIRGGYDVGDIGHLPTVTILRERKDV